MFKKFSQSTILLFLTVVLLFSIGIVTILGFVNNSNSQKSVNNSSLPNSQNLSDNSTKNLTKSEARNSTSSEVKTKISSQISSQSTKITQQEFQKHFTKKDCWVSFEKKVYDITTFLLIHPGGQQSLSRFCSREIDKASSTHAGGPFGSIKIQDILQPFLVGELE